MDILDILLARAMTPQGQINTYAARAEKAVRDATQALNSITEIQENLNNIENLEEFTDAEIDKLVLNLINNTEPNAISQNLVIKYPNNDTNQTIGTCVKYYTTTGQNTDGTMTQKAITDAINTAIQNSGNNENNQGSNTPIIPAKPEEVSNTGILGIRINYNTSTITPTDEAINATTEDFNTYNMYGGRKKCLVDNDGTIIAFYGENNYDEDFTNGYQVMIYQPKFYYKRTILNTSSSSVGQTVKEELLQLSAVKKSGFKIHPLFLDNNNNELDYVLLSAYEGSIESTNQQSYKNITYENFLEEKLSSVANAIPITGNNNTMNQINAETLANNRGENWHITTSKSISAQQMLFMIEYQTLNAQQALGLGLSNLSSANTNLLNITGSTNDLGNQSGRAEVTNVNNTYYTENGKVAISYRGYENLFGSIWQLIGDLLSTTDNKRNFSYYICNNNNNNYSINVNNNYTQLIFTNNINSGWISGFGYDPNYDWLYIPNEFNSAASSIAPVGDYYYGSTTYNATTLWMYGGCWYGNQNNGIFFYNTDRISNGNTGYNTGARLLYIPNKLNDNYNTNINKWINSMGA